MRGSVANLITYKNTVYYAIGTRDELIEKGVVTKEGSKFLIFGGTRLEPARDINTSAFHRHRQDPDAVDCSAPNRQEVQDRVPPESGLSRRHATEKGEVQGGVVEIDSPEEFWSASKYLILVQN